MAVPAQQSLMTAEELFDLPNDDYKYELVEGELIRVAPTGGEHGVLTVRIGRVLDEYVEAHDLGICSGAETGFVLQRTPDIVRAPDAAFIAKERIPETGIPKTYWPFAPDLAVEVTSPSEAVEKPTALGIPALLGASKSSCTHLYTPVSRPLAPRSPGARDGFFNSLSDRFTAVQTKVAEYFSAGTRLVWVVEPATRTIYVYRSPHDVQALGEDDELNGGEVLPGFRCAARRLFP